MREEGCECEGAGFFDMGFCDFTWILGRGGPVVRARAGEFSLEDWGSSSASAGGFAGSSIKGTIALDLVEFGCDSEVGG